MKQTVYNLVFVGIADGCTCDSVKEKLADMYHVRPDKLDFLFQKHEVVVNRGLDLEKARKYQKAFQLAGAICRLDPVEPPSQKSIPKVQSTMICPKCGLEQEPAEICELCGITISEYTGAAGASPQPVQAAAPSGYQEGPKVTDKEYVDYSSEKFWAYTCITLGVILVLTGMTLIL